MMAAPIAAKGDALADWEVVPFPDRFVNAGKLPLTLDS